MGRGASQPKGMRAAGRASMARPVAMSSTLLPDWGAIARRLVIGMPTHPADSRPPASIMEQSAWGT